MWIHTLAVPTLALQLAAVPPAHRSDTGCGELDIHACVQLASELAESEPARATSLYADSCGHGHLDACVQACVRGTAEGCRRLGYPPGLVEDLRRVCGLSDPRARLESIQNASDPALLEALVRGLSDEASRRASLARLVEVSHAEENEALRRALVRALSSEDPALRRRVVARVAEPVARAVALSDPSPYVREAAVARITDPDLLLWIAHRETEGDTVAAALGRIDDPAVLERIARGQEPMVPLLASRSRSEALARVADPRRVLRIAWDERADPEIRAQATARLKDQDQIRRLAWSDAPYPVQSAAVRALSSTADRRAVARAHPSGWVRRDAIRRLSDSEVLVDIALLDRDERVCRAAVGRLWDEDALRRLVGEAPHVDTRVAAAERLTDPVALVGIARTHGDAPVRVAATRRLSDPAALASIAREDEDPEVRRKAVQRLGFGAFGPQEEIDAILLDLLETSPHLEVRRQAAHGLKDKKALKRLARHDDDPTVRAAAASRLSTVSGSRGESGGHLLLSGQYGSQGPTASIGLIVGTVDRSGGHSVPVPDGVDGVLLEAEVGARSFKAGLGVGGAAVWLPLLSMGAGAKLSYLRTFGPESSDPTENHLGVEVDLWFLAKVSLGLYKSLDGGGFRGTWGIGFGI